MVFMKETVSLSNDCAKVQVDGGCKVSYVGLYLGMYFAIVQWGHCIHTHGTAMPIEVWGGAGELRDSGYPPSLPSSLPFLIGGLSISPASRNGED